MLMDSGHIQESDADYVNKKRKRKGEPLVEPLYTMTDAAQVGDQFDAIPYDQSFEPIPGVSARFVEAGHILGSAAVLLDIDERKGATHKRFRLWFSGDIGRRDLPLLRDPVLPQGADYLLMECTYGDKPHRDPRMAYEELREVVGRTVTARREGDHPGFCCRAHPGTGLRPAPHDGRRRRSRACRSSSTARWP